MPLPKQHIKSSLDKSQEKFQVHLQKYIEMQLQENKIENSVILIKRVPLDIEFIADIFMNFNITKYDVCLFIQKINCCEECTNYQSCGIFEKFKRGKN